MSSKRKLKKDVNYVTYELLTECFTLRHFHPAVDEKKFEETVREVVNKRNELISRVNNPEQKEGENLKNYYNKIREEMVELIGIVEKLSA